jgi:hypothetical protein
MVVVLMGLNGVGAYGFLTGAHLEHVVAGELAVSDRAADVEARLDVQAHVVASLDRQLGQIDAAIEKATKRGRVGGAMRIADEQRRPRPTLSRRGSARRASWPSCRSSRQELTPSASAPPLMLVPFGT